MDFAIEDEFVIVRMNGGKLKNSEELKLDINENLSLKSVLKASTKKFGGQVSKDAKIYDKNGVKLFGDDFNLVANGDILYFASRGEDFNYCAILDDYELGRTLGQGGFGKVILGVHKEKKQEVAIKFLECGDQLGSAHLVQQIYKEAEALKALQHKSIVRQYHAFIEGKQFIMIMEAALGGELRHYFKEHEYMEEPKARHIILQVVQAMLYCHSRGVIHRDLKLENVLFKNNDPEDFTVKVIDFGIAGVGDEKVDAGTYAYMAPECFEKGGAKTNPAIDVWAIGVMFYTMIYGTLPFMGKDEKELIHKITSENVKFPQKEVPITQMGKETIKAMLQKDPNKRIELIEFVQMPYNIMEDEEFGGMWGETVEKFMASKANHQVEEEAKISDKFMKLDIKEEKEAKPKRDKSTGKEPKKKKKVVKKD